MFDDVKIYQSVTMAWLSRKVQGTVKWVGTTEAAALLRQFGIRARIVDFKGDLQLPASQGRCTFLCSVITA